MKMLICCIVLVLVFYKSIQADDEVDFSINPFLQDSGFIITNNNYWKMQEYLNSLLELTAPAGNDDISNAMRPKIEEWKTQATTWKNSLRTKTQQHSLEIAEFAETAVETFTSVETFLANGEREEIRSLLDKLKISVVSHNSMAQTVSNLLAIYKDQVAQDGAEAEAFLGQFTDNAQSQDKLLITTLTNSIAAFQEGIERVNNQYNNACFSKGYTPVYTKTALGSIISPTTEQQQDIVISTIFHTVRVMKKSVRDWNEQLSDEEKKIVYVNTWKTHLEKLHGLYQSVQVSFKDILGIWTTLSNTIDIALEKFDKYGPENIRTWHLSPAIRKWTDVGNLAKEYSSTVNIQQA